MSYATAKGCLRVRLHGFHTSHPRSVRGLFAMRAAGTCPEQRSTPEMLVLAVSIGLQSDFHLQAAFVPNS